MPIDLELEVTDEVIAEDPAEASRRLEVMARRAEKDTDGLKGYRAMIDKLPQLRAQVLASAIRALGANRSLYDRGNKAWIVEPDWQARLKAVVWIGSYSDGLPAQTTLNVNFDANASGPQPDLEEAMRTNPALRERLKIMLKSCEVPVAQ